MKYKGQDKEGRLIFDGEGDIIKLTKEMPDNGFLFTNFHFDSSGIKVSEEELLRKKFKNLAEKWREETKYLSDVYLKHNNKNYREIIEMGEEVIPFILEDLKEKPSFWMDALQEISGEDVVENASDHSGYINKTIELWLKWGKKKGYIG